MSVHWKKLNDRSARIQEWLKANPFLGLLVFVFGGLAAGIIAVGAIIENFKTIREAALGSAQADSSEVAAIKKDVLGHSDTIKMVVRDATRAREDIDRIDGYAMVAKEGADEAVAAAKKATEANERLTELAEFSTSIAQASNDDRFAFQKLLDAMNHGKEPFKSIAKKTAVAIATRQNIRFEISTEKWKSINFDPDKAPLIEYLKISLANRADFASDGFGKMWRQSRFSKREKLDVAEVVLINTQSVIVLETVCMGINQEAKLNKNIILWDDYLKWLRENKEKYENVVAAPE